MSRISSRGEDIRRYILEHVHKHPRDINKITAKHFGITRQAVSKHLQKLCAENALKETGHTKNRHYQLTTLSTWETHYPITAELAEDRVWTNDIRAALSPLPDNALNIWQYGFTEMFNNAIDHSEGSDILVAIKKNSNSTEMLISDNGIGIFKKIQTSLNLLDEQHAILELSKGKLTTDSRNHRGEGIFFTSRMFDLFNILSGGVFFTHQFGDDRDWVIEKNVLTQGTCVWMELHNHTSRTSKKILDQYTSGDDYGFNKTVVPVKLAQYGDDKLVSRSQAKRLLARIELFKVVIFDFQDVDTIGQAFADEIFRVFAQKHRNIEYLAINTNTEVKKMISRATST